MRRGEARYSGGMRERPPVRTMRLRPLGQGASVAVGSLLAHRSVALSISAHGARVSSALATLAGMAMLAGCVAAGNDRVAQGGPSVSPPNAASPLTLPVFAAGERGETPTSSLAREDAPKLTGLSRANWPQTVVRVPVDGTYAFPVYAREYPLTHKTARQRGSPVNIMAALEQSGTTVDEQYQEIVFSPFLATWDLIRSPYDMIADVPPWQEQWHPTRRPYARAAVGVPMIAAPVPAAPPASRPAAPASAAPRADGDTAPTGAASPEAGAKEPR